MEYMFGYSKINIEYFFIENENIVYISTKPMVLEQGELIPAHAGTIVLPYRELNREVRSEDLKAHMDSYGIRSNECYSINHPAIRDLIDLVEMENL